MKQLQLNGKTLGVVDVPDGAYNFGIYWEGTSVYWLVENNIGQIIDEWESIPKGQWSILGRLNDITEEQAAGLAERDEDYEAYKNYDIDGPWIFLKAINSLQSFFRSHGITGNPLIILNEKV